ISIESKPTGSSYISHIKGTRHLQHHIHQTQNINSSAKKGATPSSRIHPREFHHEKDRTDDPSNPHNLVNSKPGKSPNRNRKCSNDRKHEVMRTQHNPPTHSEEKPKCKKKRLDLANKEKGKSNRPDSFIRTPIMQCK